MPSILLSSDAKLLAQKRVYLTRENLKQTLSQFLADNVATKPECAFVSLRVAKKTFRSLFRELRSPTSQRKALSTGCKLTTEPKLHFWLTKIRFFLCLNGGLANGQIQTPLDMEALTAIAAKLELIDCKKVSFAFPPFIDQLHSS